MLLIYKPSNDLSPLVVVDVLSRLRKLAEEQRVTVLMVGQNINRALKMADDAIAVESARLALHKLADELLAALHIERLFLGGGAPAA